MNVHGKRARMQAQKRRTYSSFSAGGLRHSACRERNLDLVQKHSKEILKFTPEIMNVCMQKKRTGSNITRNTQFFSKVDSVYGAFIFFFFFFISFKSC